MTDHPKPLDEKRLFILAVHHCLRDGVLDVEEHKLLKLLIRALRIKPSEAREWIGKILTAARAGKLGDEKTPMKPTDLYFQAVRLAMEDGVLENIEQELLLELAEALGIGEEERNKILEDFTAYF